MSRFEDMTPAECEARRQALSEASAVRPLTPREWIEAAELWGTTVPEWVRPELMKEELS